MTQEELETYLTEVGLDVASITDAAGQAYFCVSGVTIPSGNRAGTKCDVAMQRCSAVPYVTPAAVHVRPALVTMGQQNSQTSALGADWQYLSRRLDRAASPKVVWTHIMSVLAQLT